MNASRNSVTWSAVVRVPLAGSPATSGVARKPKRYRKIRLPSVVALATRSQICVIAFSSALLNVVLGDFGEVIVLDWGLAKVLGGNGQSDDETEDKAREKADDQTDEPAGGKRGGELPRIQPRRDGVDETLPGQVLGTPAYMSPEQARGRQDQVGPASDVYGLGAVLYEILVGEPPFQAGSADEVLRHVIERSPVPPRSRWRSCPSALEAICLHALNKDPAERYESAAALANDVRQWLADEPVSVYAEPLTQRLARWSRRHRTLVTTAAALLVTAVVGLTIGLVVVKREQVKTQLAQQRAETNRDLARGAVDQFLVQVSSNTLLNQPGMQALRRQLLESAADYFQQIADAAGNDPASRMDLATAYGRQAQLRFDLGEFERAIELNQRACELLAPPAGQQITDGTQLAYLAMTYHNQGRFHGAAGDRIKAAHCFRTAAEMRSLLVRFNAQNAELRRQLAADHTGLAGNLYQGGQWEEALAAYQHALELIESPGSEYYHQVEYNADKASIHYNLALIHRDLNRSAEAQRHFDEAIRLQRQLIGQDPGNLRLQNDLIRSLAEHAGIQQWPLQDRQAALVGYTQALRLAEDLLHQNPLVSEFGLNVAAISNNLALLHQQLGQPDPAMAALSDAVPAWRQLVAESPLVLEYQAGLADAWGIQGLLQRERAEFEPALKSFVDAALIMKELNESHADQPLYALKRANLLLELGNTHFCQARWDAARTHYREATEHLNALRTATSGGAAAESTYLLALGGLAEATSRLGAHDEAARYFAEVLQLSPVEQRPIWQLAQARALVRRGDTQQGLDAVEQLPLPLPVRPPGYFAHERACLHALAASRAGEDKLQAEQLVKRSLEFLEEARQAGYYRQPLPRHLLRANPDLDAVRGRAEFEQLLEAIESTRE